MGSGEANQTADCFYDKTLHCEVHVFSERKSKCCAIDKIIDQG